MNEEQNLSPETNLFDDFSGQVNYEPASLGQRFLNYLIDNLFMRFALSYLSGIVVGYILLYLAPGFMQRVSYDESRSALLALAVCIVIFNYLFYYTFCEKVFKGYTLGKLITGTKAIREDGQELTFKDAILRSLSRLIPFEAFSAFGVRPWHDSLTKTMVIKSR